MLFSGFRRSESCLFLNVSWCQNPPPQREAEDGPMEAALAPAASTRCQRVSSSPGARRPFRKLIFLGSSHFPSLNLSLFYCKRKQLGEIKHGKSSARELPLTAPSPRQTLLIDRSTLRHQCSQVGVLSRGLQALPTHQKELMLASKLFIIPGL